MSEYSTLELLQTQTFTEIADYCSTSVTLDLAHASETPSYLQAYRLIDGATNGGGRVHWDTFPVDLTLRVSGDEPQKLCAVSYISVGNNSPLDVEIFTSAHGEDFLSRGRYEALGTGGASFGLPDVSVRYVRIRVYASHSTEIDMREVYVFSPSCTSTDKFYRIDHEDSITGALSADTPEDCQAACEADAECGVWTWRGPGHEELPLTCHLGTQSVDTMPAEGHVSCNAQTCVIDDSDLHVCQPDPCFSLDKYHRIGAENTLAGLGAASADTWFDCQEMCLGNAECRVWNWRGPEHPELPYTCHLGRATNGTDIESSVHVSCNNRACDTCDQLCSIKDFSAETTVANVPAEACTANNCKWWLVTRYSNCNDFCQVNGLECVGAQDLPAAHGCPAPTESFPEISCSAGKGGAGFHRTCTCAKPADYQTCDILTFDGNFDVQSGDDSFAAPQACSGDNCNWWLVTDNSTCNEFCSDNGLVCAGSVALSPSTEGCPGQGTRYSDMPDAGCDAGADTMSFNRTCRCTHPTPMPTAMPTPTPTDVPSPMPTAVPTPAPSASPTAQPTSVPSPLPTETPTQQPTNVPSPSPTSQPTAQPTSSPTPPPTAQPTPQPTSSLRPPPTVQPTLAPTPAPTTDSTNVELKDREVDAESTDANESSSMGAGALVAVILASMAIFVLVILGTIQCRKRRQAQSYHTMYGSGEPTLNPTASVIDIVNRNASNSTYQYVRRNSKSASINPRDVATSEQQQRANANVHDAAAIAAAGPSLAVSRMSGGKHEFMYNDKSHEDAADVAGPSLVVSRMSGGKHEFIYNDKSHEDAADVANPSLKVSRMSCGKHDFIDDGKSHQANDDEPSVSVVVSECAPVEELDKQASSKSSLTVHHASSLTKQRFDFAHTTLSAEDFPDGEFDDMQHDI